MSIKPKVHMKCHSRIHYFLASASAFVLFSWASVGSGNPSGHISDIASFRPVEPFSNGFQSATPQHPGHTVVENGELAFFRLDQVEDGASVIRLDIARTSIGEDWIEVVTSLRGRNSSGLAGFGFSIIDSAKKKLSGDFDDPPCDKNTEKWTTCTLFVHIPPSASQITILWSAPFGSQLDIRDAKVFSIPVEDLRPLLATSQEKIKQVFQLIRTQFYKADQVDWGSVESACTPTLIPPTYDPLVPFAKCVVARLPSDGHSSVTHKEGRGNSQAVNERFDVRARSLKPGVGYIKLPTAVMTRNNSQSRYVTAVDETIHHLKTRGTRDWIIDLTGNGGGNVFVLLSSIASLLPGPNPALGYWEHATGQVEPFGLGSHSTIEDGRPIVPLPASAYELPARRIVAIVDRSCLSSCEILAMALSGYRNVTVVGEATGGLMTSNEVFPINDDFQLTLTTAFVANSKRERQGPMLMPSILLSQSKDMWVDQAVNILEGSATSKK